MRKYIFSIFFLSVVTIAMSLFLNIKKSAKIETINNNSEEIKPTKETTKIQIQPLTLEKIFFGDKSYLAKLPQDNLITIVSTGDIIPARMVNMQAVKNNDFTWSYKNVWQFLKNADFTVANFESPIFEGCAPTSEGMKFCGSDKNIEGLIISGIDLVSLANNHIDNYGQEGLESTINLVSGSNIKYTGLGEITLIEIKNMRLAFLGFNFLYPFSETETISKVEEAKKNADMVIVMPHWGTEYQELPDKFERNMSKILIKAGANIILGNHPHIIQPIQLENDNLTFFAHGNFIFDQEWSEETKKRVHRQNIYF